MTLIAAVDRNWGIGFHGAPLFHLSADLRRFKALTMGHVLLMGRKTFDSLPGLLPGRAHAVLSRDPTFAPPGVTVLRSLDEAREYAQARDCGQSRETFLIGGGELYAALLDDCSLAHITKTDAARPADTFMPNLDALPAWTLTEESPWMEENGIRFKFVVYSDERKM